MVLFGGFDGSTSNNLDDTWVWDGTNWTQEFPQTSPVARNSFGMAYDSAHGQVVLFGGYGNGLVSFLGDTWVWDGSNWTQESPQRSPYARANFAMAYDSARGQVVLFGGYFGYLLNETWLWDGANWTQVIPQNSPTARQFEALAYDSVNDQTVLFGGADNTGALSETWIWDGTTWTLKKPHASPGARAGAAMAYDGGHNQTVLFSGTIHFADTWTWYGGMPAVMPPPPPPVVEPSISNLTSASGFGGFSAVAPGSWVEIYGSNLAPETRGWAGSDFHGNHAPTSLDGVSVSIGGQAAFVDYVSPTQVNAQLPSDITVGGMQALTVTNMNGTSAPVSLTVNSTEPGLLATAQFKVGGNQYVVAQLSDGNYVLPTGAISGVSSRPAKPGDSIVIYGIGFGDVTPNIPAGQIVTRRNQLSSSLQILFGSTSAELPYFGLAPNLVGLYQFNIVVPAVADSDLVPLTFSLAGVPGTQALFTAVHQ